MSEPEEEDSKPTYRVFSDIAGQVYMAYEPFNLRAKVERPVSEQTLDKARSEIAKLARGKDKEWNLKLEGTDGTASAQQLANREIKAVLEPPPMGFWGTAKRVGIFLGQGVISVVTTGFMIGFVTRGVVLSRAHLPEILYLVVLFLYYVGISMCIYLMATLEKRSKKLDRIEYLFGPYGLVVLPSLTLVLSATVFGSLTFTFHNHGWVVIQGCGGTTPPVTEDALVGFYMWHFLKVVPLLRITDVMKLSEPFCYSQARVGFMILLFQAAVVLPSINTFRFYLKNWRSFAGKKHKYVYKPIGYPFLR